MKIGPIAAPILALGTAACSNAVTPCASPVAGSDTVYVVGRGWHAEVGLPVEELDGPLAFYRTAFPGARAVMFGYGKKTFFTAPAQSLAEYVLGPFPGPAAIQVTGLSVLPWEAYPPDSIIALSLPPGGSAALSASLWNDLDKDEAGAPRLLSLGHNPVSLFYAARSRYSLTHTCNTWVADMMHVAGLNVSGNGVVFSDQVMSRVARTAAGQCASAVANRTGRLAPQSRPTPEVTGTKAPS
jgi:hypothetical protein